MDKPSEVTPRPFKVGDRVRVVRKATEDDENYDWWIPEMNVYVGGKYEVTGIGPNGGVALGSYFFPACVLAHADEPAQPDPIAALTRRLDDLATRLEAVEAKAGTTLTAAPGSTLAKPAAPPMPPLPEVPECGYWLTSNGTRLVLAEPVEYRKPRMGEGVYYDETSSGLMGCCVASFNWEDTSGFILRELIQPAAPKGYEIVGWGKPKVEQWFLLDGMPVRDDRDEDVFRWLLRPLPKVRRWTVPIYTAAGVKVCDGTLIDDGTGPRLDRERVALEWIEEHVTFDRVNDDGLRARLAEIREGAK